MRVNRKKLNFDIAIPLAPPKELIANLQKEVHKSCCISHLFIQTHGEDGAMFIPGKDNTLLNYFSSVEHARQFGLELRTMLCRETKIVFSVCELGRNIKTLQALARGADSYILANSQEFKSSDPKKYSERYAIIDNKSWIWVDRSGGIHHKQNFSTIPLKTTYGQVNVITLKEIWNFATD